MSEPGWVEFSSLSVGVVSLVPMRAFLEALSLVDEGLGSLGALLDGIPVAGLEELGSSGQFILEFEHFSLEVSEEFGLLLLQGSVEFLFGIADSVQVGVLVLFMGMAAGWFFHPGVRVDSFVVVGWVRGRRELWFKEFLGNFSDERSGV